MALWSIFLYIKAAIGTASVPAHRHRGYLKEGRMNNEHQSDTSEP
jgi:hypothetical protein